MVDETRELRRELESKSPSREPRGVPQAYRPGPETCPKCTDTHPFDRPCSPTVSDLARAFERLAQAIAAELKR